MRRMNIFVYIAFILFGLFTLNCNQRETEEQLRARAQLFEQEENYEEALATYEQQFELYPKGKFAAEALQKAAFLYYNNRNDFMKAIDLHRDLIEKHPDSQFVVQARFMIGYIYANDLKEYDLAREAYKEFLKYHADTELAESVKWELEHLGQDINEQLQNLFTNDKSNGETKVK